jgi:hypothetical protein
MNMSGDLHDPKSTIHSKSSVSEHMYTTQSITYDIHPGECFSNYVKTIRHDNKTRWYIYRDKMIRLETAERNHSVVSNAG